MNDLSRWKAALEKQKIECEIVGGHFDSLAAVCCDHTAWLHFHEQNDDHNAAEFISRVTAKVFGEWAYFKPGYNAHAELNGWHLLTPPIPFRTMEGGHLDTTHHGSGPTKLAALLSALERVKA